MTFLTVEEVAKELGLSLRTIQRYCKEDFLPTKSIWIVNHYEYRINRDDYYEWLEKHFKGVKRGAISRYSRITKEEGKQAILEHAEEWLNWCSTGKLNGKPTSPRTVDIYKYYLGLYIKHLGRYCKKPIISVENLRLVLGQIDVKSFSTKRNIYDSVRSFAKYLIEIKKLDPCFSVEIKKLKPKRFLPAKRTSLNEEELNKLLDHIDTYERKNRYKYFSLKAIIHVFAFCGLRSSELCNLKLEDVDLIYGRIDVKLGKGNKNRTIGIPSPTVKILSQYLAIRAEYWGVREGEYFFLNRLSRKFDNRSVAKKIGRLMQRAGFKDISPHSLRRTFASINSAKGRPLNHLRIALGHADLSTTQSYIMTSENEVIEAMKGWG